MSIFNITNFGAYIRQAQVLVFPLRESAGMTNRNQAVVISSSGSVDDIRIVFTVNKNIMSMGVPNTLQVSFYNLSPQTKQLLANKASAFLLETGYQEGGVPLQVVASAGISSVFSQREKENIITKVFGYDGQDGLATAVSTQAFQGVTTLKKIVSALARDIPGIEVSDNDILLNSGITTGSKGRVLTGRTTTLLQRLAREFGFSWFINNGIFKAVEDTFNTGNLFVISSAAGNLINVSPRIDNVIQRVIGVEASVILDPRINPGDLVRIESEATPLVNNTYQVTSIAHVGDTHSTIWNSKIMCLLNETQIQNFPTSATAVGIG